MPALRHAITHKGARLMPPLTSFTLTLFDAAAAAADFFRQILGRHGLLCDMPLPTFSSLAAIDFMPRQPPSFATARYFADFFLRLRRYAATSLLLLPMLSIVRFDDATPQLVACRDTYARFLRCC